MLPCPQIGRVLDASPKVRGGRWLLRPALIKTIFILADVLALLVQAGGITIWAGELSNDDPDANTVNTGNYITLAGLGIQLGGFTLFTLLAIWVQRHSG